MAVGSLPLVPAAAGFLSCVFGASEFVIRQVRDRFALWETPRCPHCGALVMEAETSEVASSTRSGFRVMIVACPNCHKVIRVGGLGAPTG